MIRLSWVNERHAIIRKIRVSHRIRLFKSSLDKVCGCYWVTFLEQTPIFDWTVVR